jgi:DNA-binding CsgD family transcriptional regulator
MQHLPTKEGKHLTRRQREVLCLLVGGWSTQKTAAILQVSPHTHKYRLMRMRGLKNCPDLVGYAIQQDY